MGVSLINNTGNSLQIGTSFGNSDGIGGQAKFNHPLGLVYDQFKDIIYVVDKNIGSDNIRSINNTIFDNNYQYEITTVFIGSDNGLPDNFLHDLVLDSTGNHLYVSGISIIYQINVNGWTSLQYTGSMKIDFVDGGINSVYFNNINGLGIDSQDNIYIVDSNNNAIRLLIPTAESVFTLVGLGHDFLGYIDGSGISSKLNNPTDVYSNQNGSMILFADYNNNVIREITCTYGYTMEFGQCFVIPTFEPTSAPTLLPYVNYIGNVVVTTFNIFNESLPFQINDPYGICISKTDSFLAVISRDSQLIFQVRMNLTT